MGRKKKEEIPTEDIAWERHEKLMAKVNDIQLFTAVAILASALSLLVLLTVVMPMDEKLNSANSRLDTTQLMQIQQYRMLNDTTPFCYGNDPQGNLGYWVDGTKVKYACNWTVK